MIAKNTKKRSPVRPRPGILRELGLCCLSSIFLILSFPRADLWFFSWMALVPLLFAISDKQPRAAFGLGYLTGFIFFSGTLYWFIHVTLAGAIVIVAYLSLYVGVFAAMVRGVHLKSARARMLWAAAGWTVLEFIRDRALSGFGWCALGHSQYKALPLIQIAEWTGVFGISFLVVLVNVLLYEVLATVPETEAGRRQIRVATRMLAGVLVITCLYGFYQLNRREKPSFMMKVALVQANIPQSDKWDPEDWDRILQKYFDLTRRALLSHPDLVIWPESAFPGFLWDSPKTFGRLQRFVAESRVPLLLGILTDDGRRYYNSAMLLGADGKEVLRHHKIHLVPFGEYMPLGDKIPLREILSHFSGRVAIEDFSSGKTATLFPWPLRPGPGIAQRYFSVLICFEDSVSYVARRFVRAGANLLVNITNDAWFLDTNEPFLHLQTSVFRAVENRRWLIRSTNTGVSCFIDPKGRIYNYLQSPQGRQSYIAGFATARVGFSSRPTFFTRWGDVFILVCFCFLGAVILGQKVGRKD